MSAPAHVASTHPLHWLLNLVIVQIAGRGWMTLWLAVFPQGRAAVRWMLHEELMAGPANRRWQRALPLYARLPLIAKAQEDAEADELSRTSGQPPELPPEAPPRGAFPWRPIVGALGWAVALVFVVVAVIMWLQAFGTMFGLLDDERVTGSAVGALAVMVIVAALPVALLHERQRFSWRPARLRESTERGPARWGWRAAALLFAVGALIVWIRTMGGYFEALPDNGALVTISFSSALGLAAMVLLAATPLSYVLWRRHVEER